MCSQSWRKSKNPTRKHLSKLDGLPDALRNRIFKKLFEQAKIANMSKEEMDDYQYSLNNYRVMYLKEDEYKKNLAERDKMIVARDRIIAAERKALAARDKALAAKDKEIAELRRKYGVN